MSSLHQEISDKMKLYKCGMCVKTFSFKDDLGTHILSLHKDDRGKKLKYPKIFKCDSCEKSYPSAKNHLILKSRINKNRGLFFNIYSSLPEYKSN